MDSRIARIRRKLAKVPYLPCRSYSFGEEKHGFRLDPPISNAEASRFEVKHSVALPQPYRTFLTTLGGSGAAPFYGLLSLNQARLPP
jgi:hypothetical protein